MELLDLINDGKLLAIGKDYFIYIYDDRYYFVNKANNSIGTIDENNAKDYILKAKENAMEEYVNKIKEFDNILLNAEYDYLMGFAETDEDFYKLEKVKDIITNRICKIQQ